MPSSTTDPRRFVGRWRLDRTMLDLATGDRGCAHGDLMIDRRPDGTLSWIESATMTWGLRQAPVSRSLTLAESEAGWCFRFADGRDFHPWQLGRPFEHWCHPDLYRGVLSEPGPDRLHLRWDVHGPAKHHRYRTRLRRARPQAGAPGR
ncbi:DUF6314 family protein [Jatrophihabitans telluris]|uniref:DUF6314 family protein n=1 Tax=Jatrophihabitans telluris TaxID=2038343 RepID=A0ABY4R6E8_9ACTN|nr:DUF6314 family protein [Jatrophihabitans telluris]UQX90129.1 DUF6314 family protein [Jatrophihabitans telluris]